MTQIDPTPAPGWQGGFEESNPAFSYPKPDLASLPLLCNLANIDKLDRQMDAHWPEFSWETEIGKPQSRCYQMFATNISRIGYTNDGRVYSIICPQQGAFSPQIGALNIEVTVTGQRGWVNESTDDKDYSLMAADMSVVGKIWFSPSASSNAQFQRFKTLFEILGQPFPLDKANAIVVQTSKVGDIKQTDFRLASGQTTNFPVPDFAKHPEAFAVANIAVQIGEPIKTGHDLVDNFNALVMRAFNLASGNLLQNGNVLTWNVWTTAPAHVDRAEWAAHAETWRKSIDADHGSPDGPGTPPRYFDGTPFKPAEAAVEDEIEEIYDDIKAYIKKHLHIG